MTFPSTPLDSRVEMYLGTTWVDVTSDTLTRDGTQKVTITRGRGGEMSTAVPATCDLMLNNLGGQYSPTNPHGDYFGSIGRNTPIRVGIGETEIADTFTRTETEGWGRSDRGVDWSQVGTGGTVVATDWSVAGGKGVHSVPATSAQRSSYYTVDDTPLLPYETYYDVDVAVTFTLPFTDVTGAAVEPANLIVHGQSSSDYYLARVQVEPDESVTLAFRRETAGTVIAGPVTIPDLTHSGQAIRVRFQIRDIFLKARVWAAADPEPSTWHLENTATFINASGFVGVRTGVAAGNTNAKPIVASYEDFEVTAYRFTGEVTSLPPRRDTSGEDEFIPVQAAGLLRRVGQGTQPVNSGLKQFLLDTAPITYWPMDDGVTARRASSVAGTYRGTFGPVYNTAVYSFGDGILASYLSPGLRINDLGPAAGSDFLQGFCIGSDPLPDALAWEFLYRVDPVISGDGSAMSAWTFRATVNGTTESTLDRWELQFRPDGTNDDIRLVLELDPLGGSPTTINLADSAALTALTDGELHHVRLHLVEAGADVTYTVYVDGVSVISGTRATHTLRGNWDISLFYDRLDNTEDLMAFGHLITWENAANIPAIAATATAAAGFAGEAAGRRFERLCAETGTPFIDIGGLDDTLAMGLQYEDYFSNQLLEIEATDRGFIFEPRNVFGLAYRTRSSLYNQDATATIDYSASELQPPFEPQFDDQYTRNDIFAQRREGSSFQATQETGRLSVLAPPDGVGRYKDEVAVNVETDDDLPPLAGWLLALGTIDDARYPRLHLNRAAPEIVANPTLSAALVDIDIGDRIVVTNASIAGIYDDISLLVVGYTETLSQFEHSFTFVCVPAVVYDSVLELDDGVSRFSPGDDSTLTAAVGGGTSLQVTNAQIRTRWTADAADMPIPIMVRGEEMSVTAVSGGIPSFVAAGASATGDNTSVTPGLPAGTQVGDVVFIFASIRNSGTGTVDTPTDWTDWFAGTTNVALFSRTYDGVWTMPTITFTGGVAGADTIAQSAAFRGITEADGTSLNQLNGSAQDMNLPGETTGNHANTGLVLYVGWKQDDWTSVDTLWDTTEIGEQVSIAGGDAGQVWAYRFITAGFEPHPPKFVVNGGAAAISRTGQVYIQAGPQTFTVVRSVNGVVKSHPAGTQIRLKRETVFGL